MIYDPNSMAPAQTPMPSGGGFRALDLTDPKDMAALRRAIADWPRRFGKIDPDLRDRMVKELQVALDGSDMIENATDCVRLKIEAVKTLAKLDEMNQKEEAKIIDVITKRAEAAAASVQVNVQNNNTFTVECDRGG